MLEILMSNLHFIVMALLTPVIAHIVLNSGWYSARSSKQLQKLDAMYIEELEHKLKQAKNSLNNMQKGPAIQEGDLDDLTKLLPNVFGQFSDYAPKWLKPFLGNSAIQEALLKKVQENPEKFADMFGKLVRKKDGRPKNSDSTVNEISV